MQTNSATDLRVQGMTCGNCARHVTEALQRVPGVAGALVTLETGRVTVRWKGPPNPPALVQAVVQAGFEAQLAEGAPAPAAETPASSAQKWGLNVVTGVIPTVLLMLGEWVFHWHERPMFRWVSLGLAAIVMAGPGRHFFVGAWRQLRIGASNMDTLVTLGSSTAFAYSAWVLFSGASTHLYFMEAAAIVTLISAGHWLEARVSARASAALRALMKLAPDQARRRAPDGSVASVPVSALVPGDRIELKPGERIPTDATVETGASAVDESMLTGESLPVEKAAGARLFAGTLNQSGPLLAQVTGTGEDTALACIIAAVQRAQTSRANIQRLGDRVSSVFVPIIVVIALAAAAWWGLEPEAARELHRSLAPGWWNLAPPPGALAGAVFTAAAVLIVACPCAMGLATPAAIMAGANAAARRGILIRDGAALEKAGLITTVLFDKTGTLTAGRPTVAFSEWLSPGGESLAAALAANSDHPFSRAVAAACAAGAHAPLEAVREVRGSGVEAKRAASSGAPVVVRLGALRWLGECGVDVSRAHRFLQRAEQDAATVLGVAEGQTLLGLLAVQDTLKPGAAEVVRALARQNLRVALVTGDNARTAAVIAAQVGLERDRVFAEVRPEAKADIVRQLQARGERVAFVGDGINDAPALEQADLGVAVSRASDVAREAADIILLRSDIEAIPEALGVACATLRTIRQNLFWAFFYNAVGVPLAALGFMSPVLCAAAMGLSDLVVIGNALRLRRWKLAR